MYSVVCATDYSVQTPQFAVKLKRLKKFLAT